MIEVPNDKMLVSLRPITTEIFSVITTVAAAAGPGKPKVPDEQKVEEEKEATIPFEKWTLPPQPEGYIQYLPYDPF